ncbi:hypothetical protein TCAL_16369 [Tigriopus californicus]|uniref:Carbohydrate kinase PfkB domain-containing protein n=1 Tax=Tigriopus californicus TaxID=6832 RepID=A0A553NZG4_TIGCA|nr:hypothetical protein TCAL_16369 [Tigriopus californicus]
MIVFSGGIFRDLVTTTQRFPKPGETLFGCDFFMGFGGKSSNQAVMCRKLGADVAMVGKLGDDDHGKAYRQNYQDLGINTDHLGTESGCSSGIASIFVNTESGENQIIIVAGANAKMGSADILSAEPLMKSAKFVVCALEMNMAAIKASLGQSGSPIHVPIESVNEVVDTTGAGDAFVGALAFFLQRFPQLDLGDVIHRACSIASLSVCKSGTQASYPNQSEIPREVLTLK